MTTQELDKKIMEEYKALKAAKEKQVQRDRRYLAKQQVLIRKATEQGIKVTDEEIDEYLKAHPGRK